MSEIPEGYAIKASSDSFTPGTTVSIYYNGVDGDYLLIIKTPHEEQGWFLNKTTLELIVQSANDVLEMR